jgi:hypothetical protein
VARKNPLGTIKDVAIGTIRKPKATAEKAVGQVVEGAKGGVGLGVTVAGQVAAKASDTVTSLMPGRKTPAPAPSPDLEPAVPATESRKSQGDPMAPAKVTPIKSAPAKKAPAKKAAAKKATPKVAAVSPDKPVNVTKELGLDAAPVAKPAPAATADKADKPLTSIDAAADVSHVDATPADIAPAVKKAAAKKAPAKKAAAKKAPAEKAPAKKPAASSPGDKLPPRTS